MKSPPRKKPLTESADLRDQPVDDIDPSAQLLENLLLKVSATIFAVIMLVMVSVMMVWRLTFLINNHFYLIKSLSLVMIAE